MARKKSKEWQYAPLLVLIIFLGAAFFAYRKGYISVGPPPLERSKDLIVAELYDENYTLSSSSQDYLFALVNDQPEVRYARFTVNTKNVGEAEYHFKLDDAEPAELYQEFDFPVVGKDISPDGEAEWVSDYIDLEQFMNQTVEFGVVTSIEFPSGHEYTQEGSIVMTIEPDVVDVDITNSSDSEVNETS